MTSRHYAAAFAEPAGSPIRELFPYLSQPGIISFAGGYPSPSLFDAEGLARASQAAFGDVSLSLQYSATDGLQQLKLELMRLGAARGIDRPIGDHLITSGSQQAFDLLLKVFIEPGDVVIAEAPAYTAAIQAFRMAGAEILEVPVDADGLQTELLEALLRSPRQRRPKLLYTVPNFSNPSGTLMSEARRQHLVRLAVEHDVQVIEDDPYGELTFIDQTPPPLAVYGAQLGGDRNPVIYLSSLSKTVAPGLRIGWLVASPEVVRRCTVAKQTSDLCTSPLNQVIAAEYLRSGRYPQAVAAARGEYGVRVNALAGGLRQMLGDRLSFTMPQGGLFLWAEYHGAVDPKQLFAACVDAGVLFVPGAVFFPGAPRPQTMRLSFASPTVAQIDEGVARLAAAFRRALG